MSNTVLWFHVGYGNHGFEGLGQFLTHGFQRSLQTDLTTSGSAAECKAPNTAIGKRCLPF